MNSLSFFKPILVICKKTEASLNILSRECLIQGILNIYFKGLGSTGQGNCCQHLRNEEESQETNHPDTSYLQYRSCDSQNTWNLLAYLTLVVCPHLCPVHSNCQKTIASPFLLYFKSHIVPTIVEIWMKSEIMLLRDTGKRCFQIYSLGSSREQREQVFVLGSSREQDQEQNHGSKRNSSTQSADLSKYSCFFLKCSPHSISK